MLSILLPAVCANLIWIAILHLYVGWAGLRWMELDWLLSYPMIPFLAFAILLNSPDPVASLRHKPIRTLAGMVGLFAGGWVAYDFGKQGVIRLQYYGYVSRIPGLGEANLHPLVFLSCAGLILSLAQFIAAPRAPWPPYRRALAYFFLGNALSLPCAYLTIRFIPALNHSRDFIHAVKMGYPAFWLVLFCGLATRLSYGLGRRAISP
jgi:hypothetical protein